MRFPFTRRDPGAHSGEGSLLRRETDERMQAMCEEINALRADVHGLKEREKRREADLRFTFRKHRDRLDRIDGGEFLALPASNPMAETWADSPEARAALAARNAKEAEAPDPDGWADEVYVAPGAWSVDPNPHRGAQPLAEAARNGRFTGELRIGPVVKVAPTAADPAHVPAWAKDTDTRELPVADTPGGGKTEEVA